MNQSRAQAINPAGSVLIFRWYRHSQPYHTDRFNNEHRAKSKPAQHHTPTRIPRRPIPFVTHVKEVRDPNKALSLFHEYHRMGYKHDYPSYSALVYNLARARDFDAVDTVLGYIQDHNIRCKEVLFIALIQHYGKANLVDKAIELFHRMTSFNTVRTLQSFNTVVNVLIDNDRFLDANNLFDRSHNLGFRLNSVAFNVMIKWWLRKGEWEKACKVFAEMLEREVQPTVVTYNSLIGYLCRKGDLDKARALLEDMIKKRIYPNAVTYALLMEGLCSKGEYTEAKKVMFDMEYRGCKPRLINFGVLMNDLGKRGKFEEAKSLLVEMKKRRFKPDVVAYNILINHICKEGRVEEANKVLTEMQVKGCPPNAATYRMMVDGFCKVEDFEGGLKVLNAMLMSRHCPRLETFGCMVLGLVKGGKIDEACFVMEEMLKKKMRLGLEAWEALVGDICGEDTSSSEIVSELISAA